VCVQVDAFEALLRDADVPVQMHRCEGEGHAFVSDLSAIRAGGSPEKAWKLFTDFLQTHLML
jgi:acetyl esterase/lipase